jgi:hypothetical protein
MKPSIKAKKATVSDEDDFNILNILTILAHHNLYDKFKTSSYFFLFPSVDRHGNPSSAFPITIKRNYVFSFACFANSSTPFQDFTDVCFKNDFKLIRTGNC